MSNTRAHHKLSDLIEEGRELVADDPWNLLDVEELLRQRMEQTTGANVGAFAVPLGTPILRRPLEDLVGRSPARRGGHEDPHLGGYEDAFDWLNRKGR